MTIAPITPSEVQGPIQVCEMVNGYKLVLNEDGHSGTRRYVDASYLPDEDSQELPDIGDSWDDNYPNLRLTNIDITYLNNDDNCPRIYDCSYASKPDSSSIFADEEDFPTSISAGFEFISVKATTGKWKWNSDSAAVADTTMIYKNTSTFNIAMRRTIKDLKEFMTTQIAICGKLNSEVFYGFPIGQVMYMGCDAEETRTPYLNSRRWNITLNFAVRRVPYTGESDGKGFNWIWREDKNIFDAPKNGTSGIYEYASFKKLLSDAGIESSVTVKTTQYTRSIKKPY